MSLCTTSGENKNQWGVTDDVLESVAALANTGDGLIFIGVKADREGYPEKVTGLKHPNPEKALRDKCASDIESNVILETRLVSLHPGDQDGEKQVMIVRVRRGTNPPYVLRDRGVYIRNDEHDRPARRADLDALYALRSLVVDEPESPWTRVINEIGATANQSLPEPWPILLVGLTPAFPLPRRRLGSHEDIEFRNLCQEILGYDPSPALHERGVSAFPDEARGAARRFSGLQAYDEGTILAKRFLRAAEQRPEGFRQIGIVALWRNLRKVMLAASRWPRDVCGASTTLSYWIALGNLAKSTLVLPETESFELLMSQDQSPPAHPGRLQYCSARGEWDANVAIDDLIENELYGLTRQLQFGWWEDIRGKIRELAGGSPT